VSVVKLGADGAIDPGFGVDGEAMLPIPADCEATSYCGLGELARLPDGALIARVWSWASRLDATGAVDATYTVVDVPGGAFHGVSHATDAGELWVVGMELIPNYGPDGVSHLSVHRLGVTGVEDLALVQLVDGFGFQAGGIALDGSGRVVAGGRAQDGYDGAMGLVRLLGDGSVDPAFGTGGLWAAWPGTGQASELTAVAPVASGGVVAVGYDGVTDTPVVVRTVP
jgi:hypothetical protein